jgi:uncharacterized membrane protein
MNRGRLEAFSDGVIAILITIMVLGLRTPASGSLQSFRTVIPSILIYGLSFVFLGIYWTNHHHLIHTVRRVTGGVLWANLHLLFWLSLIPYLTRWIGVAGVHTGPVALYAADGLLAALAYYLLVRTILRSGGADERLKEALGRDLKGRVSVVTYAVALLAALISAWAALGLCVCVAVMWFVPDRRIEGRFDSAGYSDQTSSQR